MKQEKQLKLLFNKALDIAKYLVLVWLIFVFLLLFTLSLKSRLLTDQSFLHYIAFLINEHGFVPYRDLFEINMPISYLFHILVGKFLGYSDAAFCTVNVIWMSATLTVTWFIMKPYGRSIALTSCLLFGILYIQLGSRMTLQRDVIGILPIGIG